jgi:hypothetical protein
MGKITHLLMPDISDSIYYRFWSRVILLANVDKCWEWSGAKWGKGYGCFRIKKLIYNAHRLAFFIQNKKDPLELQVCHKCDNPSCCNPNHLFLGTNKDNYEDCLKKGRYKPPPLPSTIKRNLAIGDRNKSTKLTKDQVIAIREAYSNGGRRQSELAKEYGLNQSSIRDIIIRHTWKHI